MSDNTKIEWTDATWNPINGCSLASPGCTNCYAMKQAHRFPVRQGLTRKTSGGMVWTGEVRFNEAVLDQPLRWSRPRMIFVCAHGDLFHDAVPVQWIDVVFAIMLMCPHHTFQVLTKRPHNMRAYLSSPGTLDRIVQTTMQMSMAMSAASKVRVSDVSRAWPLPNVWLGTSVEDQARADERVPILLDTPAAIRWLSCEPLLGMVDLRRLRPWGPNGSSLDALTGVQTDETGQMTAWESLDWIVAGGESGPRARPMHPYWARKVRDDCREARVPFLFKQWGEFRPVHWSERREKNDLALDDVTYVRKVGKRDAGRLLDGVEHNGFPSPTGGI